MITMCNRERTAGGSFIEIDCGNVIISNPRSQLSRDRSHEWYDTRQGSVDVERREGPLVEKYITVRMTDLKEKRANRLVGEII